MDDDILMIVSALFYSIMAPHIYALAIGARLHTWILFTLIHILDVYTYLMYTHT